MNSLKSTQDTINTRYSLFLILILFSLDQLTKYLVASSVELDKILFSYWGFGITFKMNKGFVFHLFEQYEWTIIVSITSRVLLLPIIILAYRFYKFNYRSSNLITMSFVFIIAALLGNVIDQIFLGYVRDFIIWPGPGIPNLADIFADISIIFLITEFIKNPQIDNKSFLRIKGCKNDYTIIKKFIKFIN